ncbi:hypothetical protein CBR_g4844 [Chara braunii]|uniref:HAT C-terminal dimerisation domain-containing protein n=1 Tax=Chara braunii TaxID=69332 RepID=A0A388KJ13_CHABU|nr:hypothetical protein CBR_g4844 [Chara braunii]|eukprot:GBG70017.1 hypothetical protein CBR_g4844 [Chara braunii]
MKDLHSNPWVESVILEGRDITLFVKCHRRPLAMMKEIKGCKELIKPEEVVFGVDLLMLKRLQEMRWVLDELVSSQGWKLTPWADRLVESAQRMFHLQGVAYRAYPGTEGGRPAKADLVDTVKLRVGMIKTPAYAAAYLLDPTNRNDGGIKSFQQSAIENTVLYLEKVCGGRQSDEFAAAFASLTLFHRRDPSEGDAWGGKQGDLDASNADVHGTTWWAKHGNDHPALQSVAVRALNTWSIASPCERKWWSMPSMVNRERGQMSWEMLEKLIYVHWNLRLIEVNKKRYGNVYPWANDRDVPDDEPRGEGCLKRRQLDPEEIERRASGWSKKPNNGKWRPCAPPTKSESWQPLDDEEEEEDDWLLEALCRGYKPIKYCSDDDCDSRDDGCDGDNLDDNDDHNDAPTGRGSPVMLPPARSTDDKVPLAAELRTTDHTPPPSPLSTPRDKTA